MKPRLNILKIGGNLIENEGQLMPFLKGIAALHGPKIIVHGGGKKASSVLEQLDITPVMTQGRRVTDAATLEVVTMVYGGLVNKNLVAKLQALGVNALGMSGADANSIMAHKRPVKEVDYGFAGDVDRVNAPMLNTILTAGLTPVFCALTHDGQGQLLNTNADTIAAELAIGLSEYFDVVLNYCFELNGVLRTMDDPDSVIPKIDSDSYESLKAAGIFADGMLPKLHNCFQALQRGVSEVRIGNLGLFKNEHTSYTSLVL
ncbi:acetylglutamate kinase [Flagellimonas sp. DF-77]|uniref:acetylglutamate kinase n=1 Tax=Flagellimonas algarum TaxID=3230298 RepID=UPI0033977AAB